MLWLLLLELEVGVAGHGDVRCRRGKPPCGDTHEGRRRVPCGCREVRASKGATHKSSERGHTWSASGLGVALVQLGALCRGAW